MTKKSWVILVIIFTLIGGLTAWVYIKFFTNKTPVSPVADIQNQPKPTPVEELATWIDQSEFTFQYPKSLKLNPHDEDKENYAHIELTSATYSGSLVIWVKDTLAADLDSWVQLAKVQGAVDTTLASEPAKKVITTDGGKKLITTTIRNGYLYQIEVDMKDVTDQAAAFWNNVYDGVSSSFKFTSLQTDTDGARQDVYDEEEVIE